MGMRITKLRPFGGFCAETAGAVTLIGTALAGIPVSTTHTITGSIMGVGAIQRFSAVRWGVAGRIVWACRSEERRVGKEGRSRWAPYHYKKNISRQGARREFV